MENWYSQKDYLEIFLRKSLKKVFQNSYLTIVRPYIITHVSTFWEYTPKCLVYLKMR